MTAVRNGCTYESFQKTATEAWKLVFLSTRELDQHSGVKIFGNLFRKRNIFMNEVTSVRYEENVNRINVSEVSKVVLTKKI